MTRRILFFLAIAAAASPALAQSSEPDGIVTMYRAAPGHQVELLQWLARSEEADRSAGLTPCQLYVHTQGASWDYLLVCPGRTSEQDRASEAALERIGGPQGWANGIEMRRHVAEHSDTLVLGPTSASDHLRRIGAGRQ